MAGEETRPLNRLETLRGLRIANVDAVFSTLFVVLAGGAFQTGFARFIGANYFWLGFLSALPAFVGLLQIPAAVWGERFKSRRRFVIVGAFLQRLFWVPLPILAFLAVQQTTPVDFSIPLLVFASSITLAAIVANIGAPAWTAWLSDLVPADHRSRFFANRHALVSAANMSVAIPAAWFVDLAMKRGLFAPQIAFGAVFTLGVLCFFISFYALTRQPDVPRTAPAEQKDWRSTLSTFRIPFEDRQFRRMIWFYGAFTAAAVFPGQFFIVYMLENLKLSYVMVQVTTTITSLFSILSLRWWGYLGDRYGSKPLVIIAGTGVVTMPLMWMLTNPGDMTRTIGVIIFMHIVGGVAWAGLNLHQFNLMLSLAREDQRPIYVGTISAVTGIAGGASPLLGGVFMEAMGRIVSSPEYQFEALFLISAVGRAFALTLLGGIRDPRGASTGYVLSQLRSTRPSGWMALRRLSAARSERARAQAASSLGDAKMTVAVDELVQALDDPSYEVRRQAAQALGKIGDSKALPALLRKMGDDVAYISPEVAEALGAIGDPEAVPTLIRYLDHPDPTVQQAVAGALGRIGDPSAAEALSRVIEEAPYPGIKVTALRALRSIPTAKGAIPSVERLLDSPEAFVRSTAAGTLRVMRAEESAARIRECLDREDDPLALGAFAYALGVIGEKSDANRMLEALHRTDSPLARKRIAMGVARLWGVEPALYRLLAADGMDRDTLVLQTLQPIARKTPAVAEALEAYAEGAYGTVVRVLATANPASDLLALLNRLTADREVPIEEALLAIAAAGN